MLIVSRRSLQDSFTRSPVGEAGPTIYLAPARVAVDWLSSRTSSRDIPLPKAPTGFTHLTV